ncbi:type I-D CRISPR-associated protein Cas10d/Csc3, partial [Candidatus Poribacteria bacterium]|nr:type I-D CRISPR-associated protein Cas10d/Csc3 [Candidatus Poribacteria bacterium]
MAKQKSETEELLFSLAYGFDADDLFRTYIEEIVNGKLREYQEIIQWGAKAGQSLYLHVLNGICVLDRLRPILNLDDIEVQVLFSAYSVHDLNKLSQFQDEKRSFNYLANAKNVSAALKNLEIERFFPEWQDYVKDIEVLVRAHSRYHNTYDETLDLNYDPYSLEKDRLLEHLVPIIRAMDVIDLSKMLEERAKKQDFLKEINSLFDDVKYRFVYHKVSEQRGVFTNLIHNEIARYLETEKDLLPLLYYPDGVAYLVDQDRAVHITTDEIRTVGNAIVHNIEAKTRGKFSKFIKGRPAGIQVDERCFVLGVPFAEIWNEVRNIISERKYVANGKVDDMNADFRRRLEGIRDELGELKPNVDEHQEGQLSLFNLEEIVERRTLLEETLNAETYLLPPDDDTIRLGELVRTYYVFLKDHFFTNAEDIWKRIYGLLELPLNTEDTVYQERYELFEARRGRGYMVGLDLYNAGLGFNEIYELIVQDGTQLLRTLETKSEFGVLVDYVHKYIDFDFIDDREKSFNENLKRYVEDNHVQCSTCGSEFDTALWMTSDVSANIKVQQFSNRLQGGSSGEPKRRVCSVCRAQYMLDKICYNATRSTSTFFIHLYPPSFFTDGLIKAFRKAYNKFRDPDFPSVYIKTYDAFRIYRETAHLVLPISKTKNNGNPIPEFSEALGNILTIPVNTPGQNNHTENILFAIKNALLYQRFLGCRAVLTDSSIPLFSPDEFSHFFIDHIPAAFRGWLPKNDLDSNMTKQVFDQLINLHNIQVKIGSFETDDLVRLIRSLNYDPLELYYVTHKMIKREHADEQKQFTIVRNTAEPIANIVAMKGEKPIMIHIQELARIAWEGSLRGDTLNDTSLARAIDVAFKSLKRWSRVQKHEDKEVARAILSQDIERAIKRTDEQYFGKKKLSSISQFVTVLFDRIYEKDYQGNLTDLLDNRNRIRAAYLH